MNFSAMIASALADFIAAGKPPYYKKEYSFPAGNGGGQMIVLRVALTNTLSVYVESNHNNILAVMAIQF